MSEHGGPSRDKQMVFVHDWLTTRGGAENVLTAALEIYPDAPIYTLFYAPDVFHGHPIADREIRTSMLNSLPGARTRYRAFLPLMPWAVEQFDLTGYRVIVSSSDALCHGVLAAPDQLHINYIYSPARYVWRLYHQYLEQTNLATGLRSVAVRALMHYIRLWDYAASARVDHFVAISNWVARSVWRAYRRQADVIYPPVDVDSFVPQNPRDDYYLVVSRLVPYKRLDLVMKAFAKLELPLVVIGDGPEKGRLERLSTPNIELLGWQPSDIVRSRMGRAKAFIHAAEEDFGIAPVEAMASGCPVIAYGRGGLLEIVEEGKTGLFFGSQTVEALSEAVQRFERGDLQVKTEQLRAAAERFSRSRFQREFSAYIERKERDFKRS